MRTSERGYLRTGICSGLLSIANHGPVSRRAVHAFTRSPCTGVASVHAVHGVHDEQRGIVDMPGRPGTNESRVGSRTESRCPESPGEDSFSAQSACGTVRFRAVQNAARRSDPILVIVIRRSSVLNKC